MEDDILADADMGTAISCPVCRDTYNTNTRYPINVPCGHTFCSQCANSLLPNQGPPMLMCPVCRKRHFGQNTASGAQTPAGFPKNFQLLEVIEKVIEVKKKLDSTKSLRKSVNCRDCKTEVLENSCTQCDCVKDIPNGDLDFMDRPRNLLICMDCINKNHHNHDVKPMSIVKAAFDNHAITHELNGIIARIKEKAETTSRSLINSKEELDTLVHLVEKTMARLSGKPKDAALFCIASKYCKKLESIEKNIAGLGKQAHSYATNLGHHSEFVKEFGLQSRPRHMRPIINAPDGPPGAPPRAGFPVPQPAGPENVRVVVRFAEAGRNVNPRPEQANAAEAAEALGLRHVDVFNDMLRGIFRIVDDVPPRNDQANAPVGEQDGNNQQAAENNDVVEDVAVVEQPQAVEDARDENGDDVEGNNELPVEQDVPVLRRRRGRPAVPAVVPVAAAEPVGNIRQRRQRAARHDPIQREAQNVAVNARGRRPTRRH